MKRNITEKLFEWKNSKDRKPLVLKGARQVGKTHSLIDFGNLFYEKEGFKCHYIDFRKEKRIHQIFTEYFDPQDIIKFIQFRLKIKIDVQNDLLIFDEIQECAQAITSLKYFQQEMKELDLIAAGSHLGLLKNEISFPVGKVNFLYMFPLSFEEYLRAFDEEAYHEYSNYSLTHPLSQVVHERLIEILTYYLFTGGLPEVVDCFIQEKDDVFRSIDLVRKIQNELVSGYCADFSKYSGMVNAHHIQHVFESIPYQLSKSHNEEVKKYVFKDVVPNRKGFDVIKGPLGWLIESRLCIKSFIVKKALHPLKSYIEENKFKMYLFDVGLLNCLLDIPGEVILDGKWGSFKGFIVENFVAQELFYYNNQTLMSWQEGQAELEFVIHQGADLIPLEVKSSKRSKRAKSLDSFIKKYNPANAYKLSYQNYGENPSRGFTTIPIYCCGKM